MKEMDDFDSKDDTGTSINHCIQHTFPFPSQEGNKQEKYDGLGALLP